MIGHEAWQSRFAADPAIVGRRVRLDGTIHTIVGVMPDGFGFPIADRYWTPLNTSPSSYAPDSGATDLVVFARLGSAATIEQAQFELQRVGLLPSEQRAAAFSDVELRVVPYVEAFTGDVSGWMVSLVLLLVSLLLVPPCINIAILVYARTVTRQGEFAARYVLGASRFNIVAQLFIEILVLAAGAGVVALAVAQFVVWQLIEDLRGRGNVVPFWMDFELSPRTVLFVAGLAVFAAMIAGVVPALQATGRRMQAGLRSLGSHSRPQLGGVWTALIVLQVAFSFAVLPSTVEMTWGTLRSGLLGPGFAADEYLTARLEVGAARLVNSPRQADAQSASGRFEDRQRELARLLGAAPEISAVTIAASVPGDEPWARVEIDEADAVDRSRQTVDFGSNRQARVNHVDEQFLRVFELPILTGRSFEASDFENGRNAVIVNRSFVVDVLGGGNPLGRRVRYRTFERRRGSSRDAAGSVVRDRWSRGRPAEALERPDDLPSDWAREPADGRELGTTRPIRSNGRRRYVARSDLGSGSGSAGDPDPSARRDLPPEGSGQLPGRFGPRRRDRKRTAAVGSWDLRTHVVHRQPTTQGDRHPRRPGGTASASVGRGVWPCARPSRSRRRRRDSDCPAAWLLHSGRGDGWLGGARSHSTRDNLHRGGRVPRPTRSGPPWPARAALRRAQGGLSREGLIATSGACLEPSGQKRATLSAACFVRDMPVRPRRLPLAEPSHSVLQQVAVGG